MSKNKKTSNIEKISDTAAKETVPEMIKIWKTSITKQELAELPAETFKGRITVVEDEETAKSAVETLRHSGVVGFDTETKPSFRRGEQHYVALLQLSTRDECFLFRINTMKMPQCVIDLFEDETVIKVGLSIHDDFNSLHKKYAFEPKSFVELQTHVKNFGIADNSLSRIYGILFDKRISKGQRLSNWEASELSVHQKEYAALDAVACVSIYDHLSTKGFDYLSSKYYREFDEPAH